VGENGEISYGQTTGFFAFFDESDLPVGRAPRIPVQPLSENKSLRDLLKSDL
jgi:hypothetical protein